MNDPSNSQTATIQGDQWVILFLRVVGGVSLLAFAAAVMPEQWMVDIAGRLGFDPFPESPLTFYLARNLSLLYGFVGLALIVLSLDLPRYFPLVRYAAYGTMLFAVLQLIVDSQSGLPSWWTWGESLSTFCGGVLLGWLAKRKPITDSTGL